MGLMVTTQHACDVGGGDREVSFRPIAGIHVFLTNVCRVVERAAGINLSDGDVMVVQLDGRPLASTADRRNSVTGQFRAFKARVSRSTGLRI